MVVAEFRGGSVPFKLVLGAYGEKFIAAVIKEGGDAMGETTVDVTSKHMDWDRGKVDLAFRPGHRGRKIKSVNDVSLVAKGDGVGGRREDMEVGLVSRARKDKEATSTSTIVSRDGR